MRRFLQAPTKPARFTAVFGVAVLGISTAFAYFDPDRFDRLTGLSTGDALNRTCSTLAGGCPYSDNMELSCNADAAAQADGLCPMETACALDVDADELDCCATGAVSRSAMLAGIRAPEADVLLASVDPAVDVEVVASLDEAKLEETRTPTWVDDIAPLLQQHCQECHRAEQIGPFPLETYLQAKRHAFDLATVTLDRRMPPWLASPDYGDTPFLHDRSLTQEEIATFEAWADAGAPRGEGEAPEAPAFPEGWALGEPDLIIEMPEEFEVPASGSDIYRCFVIPNILPEDAEVIGIEYQPGNPRVVHHILGYIDTKGEGAKLDAQDELQGYECFGGPMIDITGDLSGWAPGANGQFMPEGTGRKLPTGSDVIMQVHYHPTGKVEKDRSRIGLYLAPKDQPIKQAYHVWAAGNTRFRIPAGDSYYQVTAETLPIPVAIDIHNVIPHMHVLGKDMEMFAELPSGEKIELIRIDQWDFNWQLHYELAERVTLPAGSKVKVIAHYDNSADNPNQPVLEPIDVTYGEATTDEMCFGFFGMTKHGQDLTQGDKDDLTELFAKQMEEIRKKMREERARAEAAAAKASESTDE